MPSPHEAAVQRFEAYARAVLAPAIHPVRAPLEAAVFQCAEPIPFEAAARAEYRAVEPGWCWGPVWSTAWFRVRGRVPAAMAGHPVVLRFSSGTEALLWERGAPVQGFDANRDTHLLLPSAAGGEPVDLLIEAACNRPLGATAFWWDPPGTRERWESAEPGRLERCELALRDERVWRLRHAYDLARQILALLSERDSAAPLLADALRRATQRIDDADVAAGADDATAILEDALLGRAAASATRCVAVGHAHIDTAWLWPIRETRRKCLRTFANVLALMHHHPELRFLCSQAQQYAWVEEDAPDLFARIARRVREGRWEAAGAMWVEPDCNVPSGESLVRQILHADRYWRGRFGGHAPQRLLFLPDTFGFPASLPQIMDLAGLDTFITNKLSWSERNEFPHVSFRWRGIDGTEVLAHCTPGHDYNARLAPAELRRGAENAARQDRGRTGVWLQPFGYGDGGGGPTAEMIQTARLAADAEALPRVQLGTAGAFCDALHERRAALRARGDDLPAWDGELYLEYHRGTYTTQAWLKRANRRVERTLRAAEWLNAAPPPSARRHTTPDAYAAHPAPVAPTRDLDAAWKLLLLNQFHDILPGTSIGRVYDDARAQMDQVAAAAAAHIEAGVARWAAHACTERLERPMLVLNPGSTARSGFVECEGALHRVDDVPALGARVVDRAAAPPSPIEPARCADGVLHNGILAARIDAAGRITSLRHLALDREACAPAPLPGGGRAALNQLVLYEDRPRAWDAWDIDAEYVDKPSRVDSPARGMRVTESGPHRASVEVDRPLGASSRIVQRFILAAGSPRLDVHTRIEWRERRRLLRALFPVDVRARGATYEIQFGHIARPTHQNTSWDEAMFEVCAHSWADLSERGFGVALLNDGKYGHSCDGNVLGLSLLRGPAFPDPDADAGVHEFTYALMPHGGDWCASGVDREADALNDPLIARALPPGRKGALTGAWAPLAIQATGSQGVVISALKPAEDDGRLIARLVETHGGAAQLAIDWHLPVTAVEPTDLLERPRPIDGFRHDAARRRTTLTLRPFRIATLAATLGSLRGRN